jgi:hypothetical protein
MHVFDPSGACPRTWYWQLASPAAHTVVQTSRMVLVSKHDAGGVKVVVSASWAIVGKSKTGAVKFSEFAGEKQCKLGHSTARVTEGSLVAPVRLAIGSRPRRPSLFFRPSAG